jgi:hypothetical protein
MNYNLTCLKHGQYAPSSASGACPYCAQENHQYGQYQQSATPISYESRLENRLIVLESKLDQVLALLDKGDEVQK